MNYIKVVIGFISFIAMLLIACAPREALSTREAAPVQIKEGSGEKATLREAWEVEWEKTLQAAKKEGKVVVYGASVVPSANKAVIQAGFSKKYGFAPEFTSGTGGQMTTKVIGERRAGLFIQSVYIGGMNTFFGELKPAGMLEPLEPVLILPEVVDPKYWYGGKLPWGDAARLVFSPFSYPNATLAINKELVKTEEIKSYRDLLNPKWKNKILMNDPSVVGTALKAFGVLGFHTLDLNFFRQLAEQEPTIIRDPRLQVDWLAKGKYPILLFPNPQPMREYLQAGAPLAYVSLTEGTYLSGGGAGVALMNRAPHSNAAKIFINWYLSREGQTLVTQIHGSQSARIDVPTESLTPESIRQPGVKYFLDADTEEWLSKDPEFKKAAIEIFGHLMK